MANLGTTTYSFKDLVGAINSPLAGPFVFAGGKVGAGKIVIANDTTRGEKETSADGSVVMMYIPGDSGDFTIECQQTSIVHKYLLLAYNLHKNAADGQDVSNWAALAIQARNILDGSQHQLNGVSFTKVPPKAYDAKAGMITWQMIAADVQQS